MHRIPNKTSFLKLFHEILTMIEPSQVIPSENIIERIQNYGYQAMNERWASALENYFLISNNNNSWKLFIPTHPSYFSHSIINRSLFYLIAHSFIAPCSLFIAHIIIKSLEWTCGYEFECYINEQLIAKQVLLFISSSTSNYATQSVISLQTLDSWRWIYRYFHPVLSAADETEQKNNNWTTW